MIDNIDAFHGGGKRIELKDVTVDGLHGQAIQGRARSAGADQGAQRASAPKQLADEDIADVPSGTGDEIGHKGWNTKGWEKVRRGEAAAQ